MRNEGACTRSWGQGQTFLMLQSANLHAKDEGAVVSAYLKLMLCCMEDLTGEDKNPCVLLRSC